MNGRCNRCASLGAYPVRVTAPGSLITDHEPVVEDVLLCAHCRAKGDLESKAAVARSRGRGV